MSALDKLKINDDARAELKQFALGLVDKALSYKAVTLRDKSSGKEVDLDVKLYSKFARQFGREKLLDIIEKSLAEQVNVKTTKKRKVE